MSLDPRDQLLACAADPSGDVVAGALWLAAEDCPDVGHDSCLEVVDGLGAEVRSRCGRDFGVETVPTIAGVLRDRLRLRGAGGGDPRAHYLHQVLERGAGVPISCAAIWIAVGRRAGIKIEGVNLPGHFVIRVSGVLVDPMASGELLDDEGARRIAGNALGHELERLDPLWLMGASTRQILARMSRNLRGCYASRGEWELALRAADRCVALLPDDFGERRDRGLLRWRLGHSAAASEDLRQYLEAVPGASDRASVEEVMRRLRAALN